ncbi:MAG: GNAT family N-acetyltransferase, partial [Burkholderiales bacterium]
MKTVAQTGRLVLRHFTTADAAFYRRLVNEPSWLQNIGDRGIRTTADAEVYICTTTFEGYKALGFGMYVVESKTDGTPLGVCGLVKRDTLPVPDIGFAFLPEHWGRGYALEAAGAIVEHARTALALTKLLAIVNPENTPSCRLLEKLGFT